MGQAVQANVLRILATILCGMSYSQGYQHAWVCSHRNTHGYSGYRELYRHSVDCHQYITCTRGYPQALSCPLGQYYQHGHRRCDWPDRERMATCEGGLQEYAARVCQQDRRARMPLSDTCALFLDCTSRTGDLRFYDYLLECPYPQLFSEKLRRCVSYRTAHCGTRPIPVAPCEYVQYQQMCANTLSYPLCDDGHLTCRQVKDGPHPVPGHGDLFKMCLDQRTVDVRSCLRQSIYNHTRRSCVRI